MRRPPYNSQGFGVLIALVRIAVAALGAAGWYTWEKQDKNKQNTYTAQTNHSGTSQHLVRIPALGIQLTLPTSLNDFTYIVADVDYSDSGNNNLDISPTAYMGTHKLNNWGAW